MFIIIIFIIVWICHKLFYSSTLLHHHRCFCRFEMGSVWRQGVSAGDAAANAHLIPEELFVADFDISINARPSDPVYAAALIEYFVPNY